MKRFVFIIVYLHYSFSAQSQDHLLDSLDICGYAPPGWVTTKLFSDCSVPGNPVAYFRRIKKIDAPVVGPGFSFLVCSDEKPLEGWISSPYSEPDPCKEIGTAKFYLRGIQHIIGLPDFHVTEMCGDTPDGWVTLEVYRGCSIPGFSNSYYKKIQKIATVPIGTSITVCSDEPPPPGWVQSPPVGPNPCKVIDGKEFFLRGFVKVSGGTTGRCCVWHNNGTSTCTIVSSAAACKALSGVTDILYDWKEGDDCNSSPCSPTVRVNLGRFEAIYTAQTKSVKLSWQLESEEKINTFYITRSRENENFKTIGLQPDNGSTTTRSFEFTDINPYQVAYYQLHWVKGDKMYSSQIIKSFAVENQQLLLFPNPATGNVRVLLSNMQLYTTQVLVTDLSGRSVLKQTLTGGQYEVNLNSLPQGLYVVRVIQNGKTYTEKLVKK